MILAKILVSFQALHYFISARTIPCSKLLVKRAEYILPNVSCSEIQEEVVEKKLDYVIEVGETDLLGEKGGESELSFKAGGKAEIEELHSGEHLSDKINMLKSNTSKPRKDFYLEEFKKLERSFHEDWYKMDQDETCSFEEHKEPDEKWVFASKFDIFLKALPQQQKKFLWELIEHSRFHQPDDNHSFILHGDFYPYKYLRFVKYTLNKSQLEMLWGITWKLGNLPSRNTVPVVLPGKIANRIPPGSLDKIFIPDVDETTIKNTNKSYHEIPREVLQEINNLDAEGATDILLGWIEYLYKDINVEELFLKLMESLGDKRRKLDVLEFLHYTCFASKMARFEGRNPSNFWIQNLDQKYSKSLILLILESVKNNSLLIWMVYTTKVYHILGNWCPL